MNEYHIQEVCSVCYKPVKRWVLVSIEGLLHRTHTRCSKLVKG